MKNSLFNSMHMSRKRNRRIPTLIVRLQVREGDHSVTIRTLNDEYETARAIRRLIADEKFRWEYLGYFGTAPLRIVEESLINAPVVSTLTAAIDELQLPEAA
jgi:hypothetical protein